MDLVSNISKLSVYFISHTHSFGSPRDELMRSQLPCWGREFAAGLAIRLSSTTAFHLQMLDITAQIS